MINTDKNTIKGSGIITNEQREISSFDKIEISSGPFEVYIQQGDTENVEIETDDNFHQYITVENDENNLFLGFKEDIRINRKSKVIVHITVKTIDMLSVSGVCTLNFTDPLYCELLNLDVEGVFKGNLEIYCNTLIANLQGVADVKLHGSADILTVSQEGVGSFNAMDFIANKAIVSNSGVGNVSVNATQELSMTNSGVGSITYSGDAKIVSLDASGIGKIKKK